MTKRARAFDFIIGHDNRPYANARQVAEMLVDSSRVQKRINRKIVGCADLPQLEVDDGASSKSKFVDSEKLIEFIADDLKKENITKKRRTEVIDALAGDDTVPDTTGRDLRLMDILVRTHETVKYIDDLFAAEVLADLKEHYARVRLYVKPPSL